MGSGWECPFRARALKKARPWYVTDRFVFWDTRRVSLTSLSLAQMGPSKAMSCVRLCGLGVFLVVDMPTNLDKFLCFFTVALSVAGVRASLPYVWTRVRPRSGAVHRYVQRTGRRRLPRAVLGQTKSGRARPVRVVSGRDQPRRQRRECRAAFHVHFRRWVECCFVVGVASVAVQTNNALQ